MYQDLKPFSGFSLAETLDTYPLRIHSDSNWWLANAKSNKGREIFTIHLLRKDNNWAGLLSKLAIFNFIELYLDVWIDILKRTNVGEYKIVTALIIIHED
jgi:hypothetical protein